MRLGQVKWNSRITAAIFEDGAARPIPEYSVYDLICRAAVESTPLSEIARQHASTHREDLPPVIPMLPREVWACGCTYEMSASFRDQEHGAHEGFYAHVYKGERPEIFFKGTARACVGPGQPIGIRSDSTFTAPEPELAVILGNKGQVLGYTIGNDVSAWDIERQNPLYLPQSKFYTGSCALGPVIVTTEELPDPYNLHMSCTVMRGVKQIFFGEISTSRLNRRIEALVEFLLRANPVPGGSVLLTGTGIIIPQEAALKPGDIVAIRVAEIGELTNPAAVV